MKADEVVCIFGCVRMDWMGRSQVFQKSVSRMPMPTRRRSTLELKIPIVQMVSYRIMKEEFN